MKDIMVSAYSGTKTKISFYATTIGWSYGGILSIGIVVADGCSCYISWGDGKQTLIVGKGKGMNVLHDYFPKKRIVPDDGITFYVGFEQKHSLKVS
jgi:hypothetical protein